MTDVVPPLVAAARRRSEQVRRRVTDALRALDASGAPITFAAVADRARVSRSWLYRNPEIRDEICRMRGAAPTVPAARPSAERGSAASRQQRIDLLLEANRALRAENDQLRRQLATLLGEQRTAATRRIGRHAGPCQ